MIHRPNFPAMLAAALLLGASGSSALAHAHLESAIPAADSAGAAPKELRLSFTEALELRFTSVEIRGPQGRVATGTLALDPAGGAVLTVPLVGILPPGRYSVEWHATATDTHKTRGTYGFAVQP